MINKSTRKMLSQSGFSLVELAIAGMVLGILSIMLGATYRSLIGANTLAYVQEQTVINQKLGAAILNHMVSTDRWENAVASTDGLFMLPDPLMNSTKKINYGFTDTTVNTGPVDLMYHIQQQGIPASKVNGDGTAADNVRVYQKLTPGLLQTELTYFNPGSGYTGGKVVLTYDLGVIYLTNCPRAKTSCNISGGLPNAATGAQLYTSSAWTPQTTDIGVTYISSLPAQIAMLDTFKKQIDQLRASLKAYAATYSTSPLGGRALSCSNAGVSDTGNNSPYPRNACATKNYENVGSNVNYSAPASNAAQAANQGCWDGWYPLNAVNVSILKEIGLPTQAYSTTPWGGRIEYCSDYAAADIVGGTTYTPAKAKNVKPIYAAIRFNRYLTDRQNPSTDTAAQYTDNVIISF